MREDLSVRFGNKRLPAFADQLISDRRVVFDHAVVHERELAALVEMRMRIFVGNLAVRRPASVTDAVIAARRLLRHQAREIGDTPCALTRLHASAVYDCNSGRVITAILEAPQSIEQAGSSLRTSNVTDNSAHGSGAG